MKRKISALWLWRLLHEILTFNYRIPIKPISEVFLNANTMSKHIRCAKMESVISELSN